jgi:hypothetical protein
LKKKLVVCLDCEWILEVGCLLTRGRLFRMLGLPCISFVRTSLLVAKDSSNSTGKAPDEDASALAQPAVFGSLHNHARVWHQPGGETGTVSTDSDLLLFYLCAGSMWAY